MMKTSLIAVASLTIWLLTGCAAYFNQPMKVQEPRLEYQSPMQTELTNLPKPSERIVVAVYNFRDKTGQYQQTETGGSWSTVVTQGATSILIKAMEESNWFVPIEREGLANLLNERKIIRSSRSAYQQNGQQPQLPPLLFAGIMIEGGIISYDYNTITGGAGLRYFGAGGSGQYRQDRVSIYLRAVSTKNGKVLKTVNVSKTILSQKIDANFFRYVKFKRLLEVETGFTYNEPSNMAVTEAIQMGVKSLIIEGLFDGLWELENPEDINSAVIQEYVAEKAANKNTDPFGTLMKDREHRFGVHLAPGLTQYQGDFRYPDIKESGELGVSYHLSPSVNIHADYGRARLATQEYFNSTYNYAQVGMKYWLFPRLPYSPFIEANAGVSARNNRRESFYGFTEKTYPIVGAGLGFEYFMGFNRRWGINAHLKNIYFLSDEADDMIQGKYFDYYWNAGLGVSFYF